MREMQSCSFQQSCLSGKKSPLKTSLFVYKFMPPTWHLKIDRKGDIGNHRCFDIFWVHVSFLRGASCRFMFVFLHSHQSFSGFFQKTTHKFFPPRDAFEWITTVTQDFTTQRTNVLQGMHRSKMVRFRPRNFDLWILICFLIILTWLVVVFPPTHLKNISQHGNIFPKFRGENSKNVWNHHQVTHDFSSLTPFSSIKDFQRHIVR